MFQNLTKIFTIKRLTLGWGIFFSAATFSSSFNQQASSTHLRWNIFTERENLFIERSPKQILVRTLRADLFEQLKKRMSSIELDKKYVDSIHFENGKSGQPSTISILLKDSNVEVFDFYRERERKYVFDFWKDYEEEPTKVVVQKQESLPPLLKKPETKKKEPKVKAIVSQDKASEASSTSRSVASVEQLPSLSSEKTKRVVEKTKRKPYRDFRYGASFFWNYDAFSPELKSQIDIRNKTPELFYPIKNRDFKKSDEEAHLQLAINLFRKRKFGLMYKALELYRKKYGEANNQDFIEYLKAVSVIRDNIETPNKQPKKLAINMLSSVAKTTKNYELKKAIYKYLIEFYKNEKEAIESLKIAKKLYVESKENFDYEESPYAAEVILFSLSQLNQIEKLQSVINDKTIRKLIPGQTLKAYEMFVLTRLGKTQEVVKLYVENKKSFAKPVHPAILFNTAESYFQNGNFEKSIELFDEFVSQYSYHPKSSESRLRIALSYEFLEKDINETLALYKNAINRSQQFDVSFEAKLRYVALRTVRKREPTERDLEVRAFLKVDENKKLSKDLKKLLWQVRLRTMINDGDYNKALAYLTAIPLNALNPLERRVFEGDGAEIVFGLMNQSFKDSDYSKVVKLWSVNKEKYIEKVANDPYLNYIVGLSNINLNLYDGFDRLYTHFSKLSKTPSMTYPIWVDREEFGNKNFLNELIVLKSMKLKNWNQAFETVNKLGQSSLGNMKNYYLGQIYYHKENYKKALSHFEDFLVADEESNFYDPQELVSFVNNYTESLYHLNKLDKFQDVSKAIIKDTQNYQSDNPFVTSMKERLSYLNIEIDFGKGRYKGLHKSIDKYVKTYPKSKYKNRLGYIQGMSLIKDKKLAEGKKVLEKLLEDGETSETIKGLVKTELSLLKIKQKTI